MERVPVRFRPETVTELTELADYIAEQSGLPAMALGFVRRIRRRCEAIGDVPGGGEHPPDLGDGIRLALFERSAVIIYRIVDEAVEIVNVFYGGGRDYYSLVKDEKPRSDD